MPKSKKPRKAYRPDRPKSANRLPTIFEMKALFDPIFKTMSDLASGEVEHDKGIPIMLFDGEWAAIHSAMIGWACCWQRICVAQRVGFDFSPLLKLAKKLENGVMLEIDDIKKAKANIEFTRQMFLRTPAYILRQHSVTEQIAIEFEKRNLIKEAA